MFLVVDALLVGMCVLAIAITLKTIAATVKDLQDCLMEPDIGICRGPQVVVKREYLSEISWFQHVIEVRSHRLESTSRLYYRFENYNFRHRFL